MNVNHNGAGLAHRWAASLLTFADNILFFCVRRRAGRCERATSEMNHLQILNDERRFSRRKFSISHVSSFSWGSALSLEALSHPLSHFHICDEFHEL